MKNLFYLLALTSLIAISCKTKTVSQNNDNNAVKATTVIGKTLGTVSHQYQSTGCNTVIIVNGGDASSLLTLIPKDALSAEFDKEGMQLYFDYHPLKMPQPEGCSHGIPAEITNISKK
jgi:hypothetical protein